VRRRTTEDGVNDDEIEWETNYAVGCFEYVLEAEWRNSQPLLSRGELADRIAAIRAELQSKEAGA
jgi:hypothetical protein